MLLLGKSEATTAVISYVANLVVADTVKIKNTTHDEATMKADKTPIKERDSIPVQQRTKTDIRRDIKKKLLLFRLKKKCSR